MSEVLPGARLLPRAQEIASSIMAKPRASRRLTHALIARTLAAASDRRSAQQLHAPAVRHDSRLRPVTFAVGAPAGVPRDNGASIEADTRCTPGASGAIIAATEDAV